MLNRLFRRRPRQPSTREERRIRHAHYHGIVIALWGLWVAIWGSRNFSTPAFAAFGNLPHWAWGSGAIVAGVAIYVLASRPRAMAITLPGILATVAWAIIAALIFIGDFKTTGVPIYGSLAWLAYAFLVRE